MLRPNNQQQNLSALDVDGFEVKDLGTRSGVPRQQQIKVSKSPGILGYAETREEAIQLIRSLRNW